MRTTYFQDVHENMIRPPVVTLTLRRSLISVIQKMPSAGSGAFGMQSFGMSTKELPYSSSTTMKERCS